MKSFLCEFVWFGILQARACVFAGSFFLVLLVSQWWPVDILPRYDFLCLAAIVIQILLVRFRVETVHEVMVLGVFHLLGLLLELFKTHSAIGSWSYPETGYLKLGWVPLYSGFMYAAVASYICQAWRLFHLQMRHVPPTWLSLPLAVAIYGNFFVHHFWIDIRWWLIAAVVIIYSRTMVDFTVIQKRRTIPLVLSFFLIGFFIWIAENISTFGKAWVYPDQLSGWRIVGWNKITSWFLLVIISVIIVAILKRVKSSGVYDSSTSDGIVSIQQQFAGPICPWYFKPRVEHTKQ
ncbi:MAG: DUF817 domain-containing protein [Planctomycetia bacterium]|nr:DUF817 domain-containing protein [Planctomycetia bacterium]